MVRCPNRTRTKRLTPAGGTLGCRGALQVVLTVPVVLKCKSLRMPHSPEATLPRKVFGRSVRIPSGALLEAFASKVTSDIVCSSCGWSYRRLMSGLKRKAR
jgi:hypothetical protein